MMTTDMATEAKTMSDRITKATLKSFIRKNADRLFIRNLSDFDPMVDGVRQCDGNGFRPVAIDAAKASSSHTFSIAGVWLVGQSRDYFNSYSKDGFEGIEVYNSCGNFMLAVQVDAKITPLIEREEVLTMTKYYATKAGNVIVINRIVNGKMMFDKVAEIREGESLVIERERWATVAEDWLSTALEAGVVRRVVKTMGGNWTLESTYSDIETVRAETRTENTFEELQRATKRGRDTLNAY